MTANINEDEYLRRYAAQIPVLGRDGQLKLARSRVHVLGTGRVGTTIIQNLAAVGIGHISANDPQALEEENLGNFVFARPSDVGQPKVEVLKRFFEHRQNLIFEPIASPNESPMVDPYIKSADIVVSCANSIGARITADRKAILYNKPIINAAVADGRQELTGAIWYRLPECDWQACSGCLLKPRELQRGEGLLYTVIAVTAAVASHILVQLLFGADDFLKEHNYYLIGLNDYRIYSLAIQKRQGCKVCGTKNGGERRE